MGREIEFSAKKIGTNNVIESYKYIRTDQVRVRASMSNAIIGEKSIYIRGHKKALASEVSLVYHFKDLALEF